MAIAKASTAYFLNYASAHAVWNAKARQTVDNVQMRYFIVHLHRLLNPFGTLMLRQSLSAALTLTTDLLDAENIVSA